MTLIVRYRRNVSHPSSSDEEMAGVQKESLKIRCGQPISYDRWLRGHLTAGSDLENSDTLRILEGDDISTTSRQTFAIERYGQGAIVHRVTIVRATTI
jgi:hypothetical protein